MPETAAKDVWRALLACAERNRRNALNGEQALAADDDSGLRPVEPDDPAALFTRTRAGNWAAAAGLTGEGAALADLYLPVCTFAPSRPFVVGHLGQSLDGYIATQAGDSYYVTGPENIVHLHRMRALCDAIIVGAGTVAADDPELTARQAEGASPVRIVLDPNRRLGAEHRVFNDAKAATWLVCAATKADRELQGNAELVGVPVESGHLDLEALVDKLFAAGLRALFVEGGGTTVSRFLESGLLDRLQIAIASLVTGAGRPGLLTTGQTSMASCLRPPARAFRMGRDILFDCDLKADSPEGAGPDDDLRRLERIY